MYIHISNSILDYLMFLDNFLSDMIRPLWLLALCAADEELSVWAGQVPATSGPWSLSACAVLAWFILCALLRDLLKPLAPLL